MPSLPGHTRNVSQGQHLIVDRDEGCEEEDLERGVSSSSPPIQEVGGAFPGGSPPYETSRPQNNKAKGLCSDPQIRGNIKVILGSIVLTIVGAVLLVMGVMAMIGTDDGPQGWVLLFAGFLCFVPGFYHVYYILCTICGRPGYSFDRLPTFNRS